MHDRFGMGFGIVGIERENRISSLSAETCEIGILVAKTRNRAVRITNAPSVTRKTNVTEREEASIEVDYQASPNIGYAQSKQISITVHNNTRKSIRGRLMIKGPEGWEVKPKSYPIASKGHGIAGPCVFSISIPETIKELPSANLFHVLLQGNHKILTSKQFGLAGNTIWTVLGPSGRLLSHWIMRPTFFSHTCQSLT